jgi:uncharacterized protein YdeI (YjbR/CyaY-like superfamily)
MPLKKTINTDAVRSFADPAALRAWLAEHHATVDELWLKMYKKSSGIPSVTWEEVVLEALCWGWIDGIRKTLDAESFVQRLTPRRARSVWSQRNCEHVERLIAAGRMQPPGLAVVEEAKADGRWDKAYAPASTMTLPEDFLAAVAERPVAQAFLATLNKQNRYAIGYRLQSAKKPETRQRRMEQILAMLEREERFH